ncbi:MAG: hypothetical protein QG623_154 [Patescibacteria group bacterium]|nr:hypothetical protein [Patescibacteria group bacterium]
MGFTKDSIIRNPADGLEGVVVGLEPETSSPIAQFPLLGDGLFVIRGEIESLEYLGEYKRAIDDPERCGIGSGERTCVYLASRLGETTYSCSRFSEIGIEIERRLSEGYMTAKGKPIAIFPGCQEEITGF